MAVPAQPDRRAPIGILDSGVGGLTVARAVMQELPQESIRYVGDTAHAPYGPRPDEEIRQLTGAVIESLVLAGCKAIVIACNTAAAAGAHAQAVAQYRVPVLEVITPAARAAARVSRSGRIGVIATVATVESGAYPRTVAALPGGDALQVVQQACPSFVDFVERGLTSGRQITGLAQAYLDPLQRAEIDTLVLGCTHYPLLADVLHQILGPQVTLVSSARETAADLGRSLADLDLTAPIGAVPEHEFLATGAPGPFAALARRFLGADVVPIGSQV